MKFFTIQPVSSIHSRRTASSFVSPPSTRPAGISRSRRIIVYRLGRTSKTSSATSSDPSFQTGPLFRCHLFFWEKDASAYDPAACSQKLIIQFIRLTCVIDSLRYDCHFMKKTIPEIGLQKMQLRRMLLAQEQGISFNALVVSNHNLSGRPILHQTQ